MKTILKSLLALAIICSALSACQTKRQGQNQSKTTEVVASSKDLNLWSKTLRLDYGGSIYTIRYADDQLQVHWQTTLDGTQVEDFEQAEHRQIEEGIYFVSWIEQSGETVSQVLNLRNKKAFAFVTYINESEADSLPDSRAFLTLEGTITILEE